MYNFINLVATCLFSKKMFRKCLIFKRQTFDGTFFLLQTVSTNDAQEEPHGASIKYTESGKNVTNTQVLGLDFILNYSAESNYSQKFVEAIS